MTRVSVVIPCRNAERFLTEALDSVLLQETACEIVVVDDRSSDRSAAVAAGRPGVRVIRSEGQGVSAARNTGTRASSAPFLQYLDADDLLSPGKLAAQLRDLEASGADVAYGSWCIYASEGGTWKPGRRTDTRLGRRPDLDLLTGTAWAPPLAYLFRRRIVEQSGGFRENLSIAEDVRFLMDCAAAGASFVRTEGLMGFYRAHGAQASKTDRKAFIRGCIQNAEEIEMKWRERGLASDEKKALARVYLTFARAAYRVDDALFDGASARWRSLDPDASQMQRMLRWPVRAFGHRAVEGAAFAYRRLTRRPPVRGFRE